MTEIGNQKCINRFSFFHSPCFRTMTTESLRKRLTRTQMVMWQTASRMATQNRMALLTVQTASARERCNNKPFPTPPTSIPTAKSTSTSPRNFINMHRVTLVEYHHRKAPIHTHHDVRSTKIYTTITFNEGKEEIGSFGFLNIRCGCQWHKPLLSAYKI